MSPLAGFTVDVVVESPLWKARRSAKAVVRRAVAQAASMVSTTGGELAIVLTDDSAIRALNRTWRRKDEPTNVLSFPAKQPTKEPHAAKVRAHSASEDAHERAGNTRHEPGASARAALASKASGQRGGSDVRGARGTTGLLGDIVIAYETTEREARTEHKPFAHHLAHLAVHGFLHLAGYDHEADDEADAMERLEAVILARLDVPDPYVARSVKG